jgi:hypothetical protein
MLPGQSSLFRRALRHGQLDQILGESHDYLLTLLRRIHSSSLSPREGFHSLWLRRKLRFA